MGVAFGERAANTNEQARLHEKLRGHERERADEGAGANVEPAVQAPGAKKLQQPVESADEPG